MIWNIIRWSYVVKVMHFLVKCFCSRLSELNPSNNFFLLIDFSIKSCNRKFVQKEQGQKITHLGRLHQKGRNDLAKVETCDREGRASKVHSMTLFLKKNKYRPQSYHEAKETHC